MYVRVLDEEVFYFLFVKYRINFILTSYCIIFFLLLNDVYSMFNLTIF